MFHRQRIAALLLRFPFLSSGLRFVARQLHGRFSAGVVGVVLNTRGEILIVEHVFHPESPWGLPGGWLHQREAPTVALERELLEELGIMVEVGKPLLVSTGYSSTNHIDISFLCRTDSDAIALSSELLDFRWVPPEALPRMNPFHTASVAATIGTSDNKVLSQ